jgi:hypothetical protein
MRIVDIRPGQEELDIKAGKEILDSELKHQAKSVMIIVGDSADIAQFADRAGIRVNPFPMREAVWLKLTPTRALRILTPEQAKEWFPDGGEGAVVLDFDDKVSDRLPPSTSIVDIERAFLKASGG